MPDQIKKERAVRFTTDEAFAEAVHYLWLKKPFDITAGRNCLIVPYEIAEDLLQRFEGKVEEIEFIDLADASPEVVRRALAKRFGWKERLEP